MAGGSTIATLVKRRSRFVMLTGLPRGHRAEAVTDALSQAVTAPPAQLRRSLTWDQGKEMADHARFSVATGVPSTSATRTAPGSGAATRTPTACCASTTPRRTDLKAVTQSDLDQVAAELNDRPRQTLKWKSPCQALDEALR